MPHQELIIDKVSPQIGQCNIISFLIELSTSFDSKKQKLKIIELSQ